MNEEKGIVYLVGAGPGDPDLITVRGLKLLRQADVVLHDRLSAVELLAEAPPQAEVLNVGKTPGSHKCEQAAINDLLIDRAGRGLRVVRLKGGDPFLFGRGYEELKACRAAGIDCVVIPGVSSALAAPESVGIPITDRGTVGSIAIISGRRASTTTAKLPDYKTLAAIDVIVILMGRANLRKIAQSLIDAGRDGKTPAASIERATTPDQRVTIATLATIADAADRDGLKPPVVTVVGEVAAHALEGVCEASIRAAPVRKRSCFRF